MLHPIPGGPSAIDDALAKLAALQSRPDIAAYRTIDLINMGRHCGDQAHAMIAADPQEAREFLLHGASRMIAAADRLGATTGEGAPCSR